MPLQPQIGVKAPEQELAAGFVVHVPVPEQELVWSLQNCVDEHCSFDVQLAADCAMHLPSSQE